jgi:tetratricopeptide (TPR) repeat protein
MLRSAAHLERTRKTGQVSKQVMGNTEFVYAVVSVVVLVPYVGWGIYMLRQHLHCPDDINPVVEIATVLALFLFYGLEMALLTLWLRRLPIQYLLAILGLMASGAALYGLTIISLFSRLVVDVLMPSGRAPVHEPRYAPAEALERRGDFEGAVKEYMVIARIFPRDSTTAIRIGDNLMKLNRPEEAAMWFERGLQSLDSPQKSLLVTNRLFEIYCRRLGRQEDAARVLEAYLQKYPSTDYVNSVRERLSQIAQ